MTVLLLALSFQLGACKDEPKETGPDSDADVDADADTDTDADLDVGKPRPDVAIANLEAEGTWYLDFDAVAEANGWIDCSYTRVFSGPQILDQPWLCPDCDYLFLGGSEIIDGFEDCAEPLFGGEPKRSEYWGFDWPPTSGGQATLFRTTVENVALGELTTADDAMIGEPMQMAWADESKLKTGGSMLLEALATATLDIDPADLVEDIRLPRTQGYECGWPLGNPGTLATDWTAGLNKTLPNFWLEDACGDLVEAWDFYGSWFIVDSAQPDCGPCLAMAEAVPDFIAGMEDRGLTAHYLTLLGYSLSAVNRPPDDDTWEAFLASYDHGQPILKDRGYGYAMFEPLLEKKLGYPVFAIVRPDMTVLSVEVGWDTDGEWDTILAAIDADR